MTDPRQLGKKMFDDVSDDDDGDYSSTSEHNAAAPAPAQPPAAVPQTTVRHVDPATPANAEADEDPKAFATVSKKDKTDKDAAGKPQAAQYPSESPAPLVKHIQAATPQSKSKRTAPTAASTPATTSKAAVGRQREEVASDEQEMDPRGVRIELKDPVKPSANNKGPESSVVKRRAGTGSQPASASMRIGSATRRAQTNGADEDDSLLESSSSDGEFHVADYIFPRLDADLINHDRHTAKASKGSVKPPNCIELFLATMFTIDVRVALYFVTLILCLVFTIVSIPTSQLDGPDKSCYTYYGHKDNCDAATYTVPVSLMECRATATRLQAGAAFSIIALVVYLVNFVICVIVIFCLREAPQKVSLKSRMVLGSVGAVNIVMHLIPWACVAGIYSTRYCESEGERRTAYGVGFGLCITSWILNLICVVIIFAVPTSVAKRLRIGV